MKRRERVKLEFTPGQFVATQRMADAHRAFTMALELPLATWEPHDWSDFD